MIVNISVCKYSPKTDNMRFHHLATVDNEREALDLIELCDSRGIPAYYWIKGLFLEMRNESYLKEIAKFSKYN